MHHHQMQSNLKPGWPSTCDSGNNNENCNNTMDAPQYPGYPSHYWYPQSHSTGHYANSYPSGSDVQYNPQVMPGGYPNGHGIYSPPQSQYSTSGFHPSNPFYCADPQGPAPGPYPSQGCPAEQSSGPSGQPPHSQHHHYPGSHCQGGSGYPAGPYPHYSESGHAMPPTPPYPTGQPLHSSPQADTHWAHSGAYAPPQQQWQPGQQPPQNHYVRPAHPPAWPGTGTGAPPPYQPKDQHHQCPPQVGPKPRPTPSPNSPSGKPSEISSPPQMYNKTSRGEPNPSQGEPPPSAPAPAPAPAPGPPPAPAPGPAPAPSQAAPQPLRQNPSLARVQEVMSRVLLLQEDVDEFVGKKTDKNYRCLEELLTKELLVLDSVETRGQENVRQARKEAVQRIQAILDQLEKKAF